MSAKAKDAKPQVKRGPGRPRTVFTEKQVNQVEALASVLSIAQIADYFGIGYGTFRDIKARQPEISDAYKRGRAKAINDVASGLLQKARDGDTTSAIFYLKTQAGWRETNRTELTSPDGSMSPRPPVDLSGVSDKALKEIAKAMEASRRDEKP